jgi:predicted membrane protein (TIGR00267 family)
MIDGTLITLGVVTATREVTTLALALTPALAAGLSSALSNAFGAYVAETAVAGQELAEFEKHLMVRVLAQQALGLPIVITRIYMQQRWRCSPFLGRRSRCCH